MDKILSLIITAAVIGALTIPITKVEKTSHYTALGDSISTGYGVEEEGSFVNLTYEYLKGTNPNLQLKNMAVNGQDSSGLLSMLEDEEVTENLKKSKVITITIGSNNILNPVSNLGQYTDYLAVSSKALTEVQKGIESFNEDLPQIISLIKSCSPKAKIYVLNIYNPFKADSQLYSIADNLIKSLNSTLEGNKDFQVVDVYSEFNKYNNPPVKSKTDPHPSDEGHALIFELFRKTYEEEFISYFNRNGA